MFNNHLTLQSALSSFQPGTSNATPPPHISFLPDTGLEHLDESNGSSTETETEEEWLDTSQLAELACRFPSRMSEAMAIEVCL